MNIIIGESGFISPDVYSETGSRLEEVRRFFSDGSSAARLWTVGIDSKLIVGGLETGVSFPAFLEYYVIGRNAQLMRGVPPPFYEKLAAQIHHYAASIAVKKPINPFSQTMLMSN